MFICLKKNLFFGNVFSKKLKKNFDKRFVGRKVLEILKKKFSKKHFQKKDFFSKKWTLFFFKKNKVLVYRGKKIFFSEKKVFLSKIKCPLNCLVQKRTLSPLPWNKHRCPDVPAARYVCGIPTMIPLIWNCYVVKFRFKFGIP